MSVSRKQPLTVAVVLHRYRLAAGYTQEELAERAGISARSVSDIERGTTKAPHADTLDGLADALGLSTEERDTLLVAARAYRTLGGRQLSVSSASSSPNRGRGARVGVAARIADSLTGFHNTSMSLHVPARLPRVAAASAALLIVVIAFVATHRTTTPTASSATRAFVLWPVTKVRPVVLGRIQAFATDRHGNLLVGADDAVQSRNGIWKLAPTGQVLGHWSQYGKIVVRGYGVALDGHGNIYVADANINRLYKLSPDGRWITAWGSTGTKPGQFMQSYAVAADAQDRVYVGDATSRIQKFSSTGTLLAAWPNCGMHQSAYCGLAQLATDGHNNLYVGDFARPGSVYKLSPEGTVLTRWISTADMRDPGFAPVGLTVDPQNNILAANLYSGGVYKFLPRGKMLHWLQVTRPATGFPLALAVDPKGNAYVTDCCRNTIRKFSVAGVPISSWAPFQTVPVPLSNPAGIAFDRQGRLVVLTADRLATVLKLSSSGHRVTSWQAGVLGRGQAHAPAGVTVDTGGNVYVVDALTNRIIKLSRSGTVVHSWGAHGSGVGGLESPSGVAVDPRGNIYVTDSGNYRVVKFSPTGTPAANWGASAMFVRPRGIAVDAGGHVYVADTGTRTINKLSTDGRLLEQWRGTGKETLIAPTGVAVDGHGNLFVTDNGDSRVKEFSSSGGPIASWGKRGTRAGEFLQPDGIAVDRAGVVMVADTGNNRLQRLSAL